MQNSDLASYLWQLIRGDAHTGDAAATHLTQVRDQVRSHPEEFPTTANRDDPWPEYTLLVRATIGAPDFPTRQFLLELIEFMHTTQERRMQLYREEKARQDAISDRILARLTPTSSAEERRKAHVRLAKIACASNDPKNEREQLQTKLLNRQIEANILFSCLHEELLSVTDKLHEWLEDDSKKQRRLAEALERLGTSASAEFLPALLAQLDRAQPHRFSFVRALASLARNDAPTVRALIERVQLAPGERAINPLQVLRALGPRAAELVPTLFPVLLTALDHSKSRNSAVYALGTIASNNNEWGERIALRLLELSRTDDVWLKGATIWALGDLKKRPDVVVPRLIEAFDDYEEPDPDYNYGSSHTFVTNALTAFGPEAAPAVPALLKRLRNDDGELDSGVLKTLAAIGPAAGFEAWERLDALSREVAKDYEITVEELLSDDEDDLLGQALRATNPF